MQWDLEAAERRFWRGLLLYMCLFVCFFQFTCVVAYAGHPLSIFHFPSSHILRSPFLSLCPLSSSHSPLSFLFHPSPPVHLLPPSLLASILPSVSWQKMSHASSWEAKTLSLSLNISSPYFSSPVFLSASLTLLSAMYHHLFLYIALLCSVTPLRSSFLLPLSNSLCLSVSLKVKFISLLCFHLPLLVFHTLQQCTQLFSHSLVS